MGKMFRITDKKRKNRENKAKIGNREKWGAQIKKLKKWAKNLRIQKNDIKI